MVPILDSDNAIVTICEPYMQKDDTGKTTDISSLEAVSSREVPQYLDRLEAKGYYWQELDREQLKNFNENASQIEEIFQEKIYMRLRKWAEIINQSLPVGMSCFWTGGNDDDGDMLARLTAGDLGRFEYAEGAVVPLGEYELISVGYSNRTPFYTSRELDELELLGRLSNLAQSARTTERLILNVHVPPYDCGHLDLCLNPENPSESIHVGSTGVRTFIENTQPLVDFVGHVHEGKGTAKIGRTYVFNPGSEYNAGILHGVVVDIKQAKIRDYLHFSR
jgi:hypothetical protein